MSDEENCLDVADVDGKADVTTMHAEGNEVSDSSYQGGEIVNKNNENSQKANNTTTSLQSLHQAILCPRRINALMDCDSKLEWSKYEPSSWAKTVLQLRGRNFQMILGPLFYLVLWDILWVFFFTFVNDSIRTTIQSMEKDIVPLLTPISFLLVFRLGRAAVRYWDARQAVGKMIEVSRTFISTSLVGCCSENKELMQDFVRWVCVFPISVKNFLRPQQGPACSRRVEIGSLLSDNEANELLLLDDEDKKKGNQSSSKTTIFVPIIVLNRLRQLAFKLSYNNVSKKEMLYRQLNEQIDILTGSWGAMERINGTPLPFVYVAHLRTFLVIYLFFLHLEAIARNGWYSIIPLFLTSWGLLGLEAAAVECERPFRWHSNHLPLGRACVVVANNVAQTMHDLDLC